MSRDPERDEPPVVDLSVLHRREARRLELAERRRVRRQRIIGALVGVAVVAAAAFALKAFVLDDGGGNGASASAASTSEETAQPVRVNVGPPPPVPAASQDTATAPYSSYSSPDTQPPDDGGSLKDRARAADKGGAAAAGAGAPSAAAASGGGRPVVWVQAGHTAPREPGYADQSGAGAGAFGSEIGFTSNLAPKVVAKLKAEGVDARQTPGEVTPNGASGAVFISLHYDTPEGRSVIGYATTGGNENYYHGEGYGTASQTPYSDSAPHRPATTVSAAVSSHSQDLAQRLSSRYAAIFTAANGARSSYGGVQTPSGNPRVARYYGFYRVDTDARVLIECGAGVTDDAFLQNTDRIATAISAGITDHLRARGLL